MATSTSKSSSDENSPREQLALVHSLEPAQVRPLREVVEQARAEIAVSAALYKLADHGTATARKVVRDALDDRRVGVRADAALLLGRIGTRADYDRMASIRTRTPRARRKIRFGTALLAHRHGLDVDPLPVGDIVTVPSSGSGVSSIDVAPVEADQTAACVESLTHSFGVPLAGQGAELICGRERTLVVPTAQAVSAKAGALPDRPLVLAVAASPSQEADHWSADWVVLATPQRDGVALRVASSSGRVQFAGHGRRDGDRLTFEVGPLHGAAGPQVDLAGSVGPDGLVIDSAHRARRPGAGAVPTSD
jgi:hypothetical protein